MYRKFRRNLDLKACFLIILVKETMYCLSSPRDYKSYSHYRKFRGRGTRKNCPSFP